METHPEAERIVLACLKPNAPPFHQFIVRKKLLGGSWQAGDRAVIYEIVATVPAGRVLVTDRTAIQFETAAQEG
ncbi:MAG: hypothetical protein AB1568_10685 [Thermodesulfobacteriota bacterium]